MRMLKPLLISVFFLTVFNLWSCDSGNEGPTDTATDTQIITETETETITDTDSATDTSTMTDTQTGSDSDSETDTTTDGSEDTDDFFHPPEGWTEETHGKDAEPNYEAVFEGETVRRMDIVIAPSDWQAMVDDTSEDYGTFGSPLGCDSGIPFFGGGDDPWDVWAEGNPIYVPCDITFEGRTWYHVGIRFKGDSSLAMSWQMGSYKLPFRFNFDKFEDEYPEIKNQRFYGFDKLALSSAFMDNSLSREKLTCDIFRAAGVPAAHAAFYRVFIDVGEGKKYFGLYTLQEIPAKPMLKTVFLDDDGNLYKPEGTGAAFDVWNEEAFDKETNEDEADFSDVRALFDALHSDRSDPAAFRAAMESVFDVDGFLRYLAVNQVITNWDSYGRTPHNYFIYNDPGDSLIHWIPWDFNLSLGSTSGTPPLSLELNSREVGENWPLIRYLIDDPEYKAKYVEYVQMTIENVFYPERMQAIYTATQELIRPYVVGEEGETSPYTQLTSQRSFDREYRQLMNHVENRYNAARSFLEENQ